MPVAKVKAAIATGFDKPWNPIDSAPKDGTRILAYSPKAEAHNKDAIRITWWRADHGKYGFVGWGEFNDQFWPPTHWQPLPKAP